MAVSPLNLQNRCIAGVSEALTENFRDWPTAPRVSPSISTVKGVTNTVALEEQVLLIRIIDGDRHIPRTCLVYRHVAGIP
jgi:hypothetical protein